MDIYISDLDGTLLNTKRTISDYSKKSINKLINDGVSFTIATARTPGTVVEILEGINIKNAISLMNGVFLYDLLNKNYLKVRSIDKEIVKKILDVLEKFKKDAFVYGIKDNHLYVYHKTLDLDFDKTYFEERKDSSYKTFKNIESFDSALDESEIVNFMILDTKEKIELIYEEIDKIQGINKGYYKDVYDENCYFIEIHSIDASKERSVQDLKELYSADKVICFGDNMNDLPMFKVADEKYAMSNAVDGLKKYATDIIKSNDEDGVAMFLNERFKN